MDYPVLYFAYPFGDPNSYDTQVAEVLRQNGFKFAFTLVPPRSENPSPYFLGRKNMHADLMCGLDGEFSPELYSFELSGLADSLFPWRCF